ncbi:MAG: carboxy-S-adenosyl-L-methionine synthase CmoA [Sutterellaceae bacterium]|nr:carboxy-S-adenosyl-L-methionine synthase CmoA [Sutterellaceae bacterium]|tara:strand:- start:1584 stop:2333 length:750 start_codon:yes stop_codon:yes gene_type:complete
MPSRDTLFTDDSKTIDDFNFDETTAAVFDDMLDRSIPHYRELQRMMGEIAAEFSQPNTAVYDLGCSTGITLDTIRHAIAATGKPVNLVGLDYSEPMLDRARERFAALPDKERPGLAVADLNYGCVIQNASVVVLNLTLQFIRPLYRDRLIRQIAEGLDDNGCLILVEKVLSSDSQLNRLFIKLYYDMKRRNGYSDTEIARKREALENVLIPYRIEENVELLTRNGFAAADTFFKWYNFAGIVAVKKANQ